MISQTITAHIDSILSVRNSLDKFKKRVEEFARDNSVTLGPNDKQGMAQLAESYVRSMADLLSECDKQSAAMGLQRLTLPILQIAVAYFLNPVDYISDDKGLYGLLDDAYLACRFVTLISNLVQSQNGYPLLDTTLDERSSVIRVLLGEPLATRLDQEIESTLNAVIVQIQIEQVQNIQLSDQYYSRNEWAHRQNVINTEAEIMSIASGGF